MIPSFKEAIRFWFRLGWSNFGGPAGQISLMHKMLVEEKKWISEDEFSHALNYCMFLPGPEAQQLATYLGWILHGTKGGIFAGLFFILPSVLIFLGISIFYFTYGSVPYVTSFLNGIKPSILAIILLAFGNLVRKSLKSERQVLCFVLTTIGILFLNVSYPILLTGAILLGTFSFYAAKKNRTLVDSSVRKRFTLFPENLFENDSIRSDTILSSDPSRVDVETSSLNGPGAKKEKLTPEKIDLRSSFGDRHKKNSKILKDFGKIGSVGLILWAIPFLGILFLLKDEFAFWKELILFFTKTALITFGGAYAILPMVAEFATRQAGWVGANEMIDGLAFGESTPGPLIMVLTFIGFLAGAHRFGSIGAGIFGLLLTAYYIFLPSFILILGGANLAEKTKESDFLRIVFGYVTACVCGVILYLAIFFAGSILFEQRTTWELWARNPYTQTNWLSLFWTVLGVLILKLKKEYSIFWIFFSGFSFLGAEFLFHL